MYMHTCIQLWGCLHIYIFYSHMMEASFSPFSDKEKAPSVLSSLQHRVCRPCGQSVSIVVWSFKLPQSPDRVPLLISMELGPQTMPNTGFAPWNSIMVISLDLLNHLGSVPAPPFFNTPVPSLPLAPAPALIRPPQLVPPPQPVQPVQPEASVWGVRLESWKGSWRVS